MKRIKLSNARNCGKQAVNHDAQMKHRAHLIENTCVHFNGVVINDVCSAGVNYHGMMGTGTGCFAHIPCLRDDEAKVSCKLAKFPSASEAADQCRQEQEDTDTFMVCIAAAKANAKSRGLGFAHGGSGQIQCPKCRTGIIHYSVASTNGHMMGKCTTAGCIQWVE